jgi:hypothetical protein
MGVTCVDKSHPFKVNDSLFNNRSHFQQMFYNKLVEIVFQRGFEALSWFHNDERLQMVYGVVI